MDARIASPSIIQTQFPSYDLVRLKNKGIATPQGEGELRGGGRGGLLIPNFIWVGNTQRGPRIERRIERYDPEGRLVGFTIVQFDIRSYSIGRMNRVYVFGGPSRAIQPPAGRDVFPHAPLYFGCILDANTGEIIKRFRHPFGFCKACAASMESEHVLISAQNENRLFALDMQRFESSAGRLIMSLDDAVWSYATKRAPRGVVQSGRPPFRVWIACKVANRNPNGTRKSFVQRFTPPPTGEARCTIEVPFGPRGVCINPAVFTHDEVWVAILGENLSEGDPDEGTAQGSSDVIRIEDFAPTMQPPVVTRILLGAPGDDDLGPFSIAASVFGNKYVACTLSNEVWKIPLNPTLMPIVPNPGPIPYFSFPRNAVQDWPVQFSKRPIPGDLPLPENPGVISVSIDGNGHIWVLFKNSPHIARIKDEKGAPPTVDIFKTTVDGKPDTPGDFTGYYTAASLFPGDDSDGDGKTNIDELTGSPPGIPPNPLNVSNPFDPGS